MSHCIAFTAQKQAPARYRWLLASGALVGAEKGFSHVLLSSKERRRRAGVRVAAHGCSSVGSCATSTITAAVIHAAIRKRCDEFMQFPVGVATDDAGPLRACLFCGPSGRPGTFRFGTKIRDLALSGLRQHARLQRVNSFRAGAPDRYATCIQRRAACRGRHRGRVHPGRLHRREGDCARAGTRRRNRQDQHRRGRGDLGHRRRQRALHD